MSDHEFIDTEEMKRRLEAENDKADQAMRDQEAPVRDQVGSNTTNQYR